MTDTSGKRAIIVGASSGIGRSLAKKLSAEGYHVGLAARRLEMLEELRDELSNPCYVRQLDVRQQASIQPALEELIADLGGLDAIYINAGVSVRSTRLELSDEMTLLETNVIGAVVAANVAAHYFLKQRYGQLIGISSVAGMRGSGRSPGYTASKAYLQNYFEGLRQRLSPFNIQVTDIRPGYVDTPMITGRDDTFWMSSPEKAANQIVEAVNKKKNYAYITKRWVIIAWIMKFLPCWLYDWAFQRVYGKLLRDEATSSIRSS